MRRFILGFCAIVVVLGIVIVVFDKKIADDPLYLHDESEIDKMSNSESFEKCVQAGNAVMESYPRQCRNADGKIFTEQIDNESEFSDMIVLDNPQPNQLIKSPLLIAGRARGGWYFEGDFPVVLTNWDGLIIAEGLAFSQGEWMTNEFVPFQSKLEFVTPVYGKTGALILKNSNPSGLPQHDRALEIPIRFSN